MLIVTPLTFLGGSFLPPLNMLPPVWQKSRSSTGRVSDQRLPLELLRRVGLSVQVSVGMTLVFLALCLVTVRWCSRAAIGSRHEDDLNSVLEVLTGLGFRLEPSCRR